MQHILERERRARAGPHCRNLCRHAIQQVRTRCRAAPTALVVVPVAPLARLLPPPKEMGEGSSGLLEQRDALAQEVRVRRLLFLHHHLDGSVDDSLPRDSADVGHERYMCARAFEEAGVGRAFIRPPARNVQGVARAEEGGEHVAFVHLLAHHHALHLFASLLHHAAAPLRALLRSIMHSRTALLLLLLREPRGIATAGRGSALYRRHPTSLVGVYNLPPGQLEEEHIAHALSRRRLEQPRALVPGGRSSAASLLPARRAPRVQRRLVQLSGVLAAGIGERRRPLQVGAHGDPRLLFEPRHEGRNPPRPHVHVPHHHRVSLLIIAQHLHPGHVSWQRGVCALGCGLRARDCARISAALDELDILEVAHLRAVAPAVRDRAAVFEELVDLLVTVETERVKVAVVLPADVPRRATPCAAFARQQELPRIERRQQLAQLVALLHRVRAPRVPTPGGAGGRDAPRRAVAPARTLGDRLVRCAARERVVRLKHRVGGHGATFHLRHGGLHGQRQQHQAARHCCAPLAALFPCRGGQGSTAAVPEAAGPPRGHRALAPGHASPPHTSPLVPAPGCALAQIGRGGPCAGARGARRVRQVLKLPERLGVVEDQLRGAAPVRWPSVLRRAQRECVHLIPRHAAIVDRLGGRRCVFAARSR